MKQRTGVIGFLCSLLAVLAAAGCIGIGEHELRATFEPSIRATASHEVAPTLTAAAESRITLETFHERYVIALGEREGWALGQTDDPSQGCARFTLYPLENSQVALKTCLGRYVIAPRADQDRTDWRLSQAPELDECGQFVLHKNRSSYKGDYREERFHKHRTIPNKLRVLFIVQLLCGCT